LNTAVVNLGLKSVRCIVFDEDGHKLSSSSLPISTYIQEKKVEQDPHEWWEKTKEVIGKALLDVKVRDETKLVSVTASASCLVCVDKEGSPLMNAIMVSDGRAERHAEILENIHEFQSVKLTTGMEAAPDLLIPKIMWLKDNMREVFDDTYKFLTPGDFLILKLTGEFVTDTNNALKFYFDPKARELPKDFLDSVGIDVRKFPSVVEPSSEVGRILNGFGFPKDAKLIATTYDALCALFGSGILHPGEGCDVSGTVTSLRGVVDKHIVDPRKRVYSTPYIGNGNWIVGGSNNLGGGAIEWAKQILYGHEEDPYLLMEEEATSVNPCPDGLVFLPYLLGERAPIWNPSARGVLFGLTRRHTRKEIIRAIFEGIGFGMLDISRVLSGLGVEINSVALSGGLSRVDVMSQIKADMLGVPVYLIDEFETSSVGSAILAGVGGGLYSTLQEGINVAVRRGKSFTPDEGNHKIYSEYFGMYKYLYRSLRGMFAKRIELMRPFRNIQETMRASNL